MKKYPNYIESLISELRSSEFADEILKRYDQFSGDPILVKLYESFLGSQSQFFFSSVALDLIQSALATGEGNDPYIGPYYGHNLDGIIRGEELGFNRLPILQDSSLSTLWSQSSNAGQHKTLKQLSFEVKEIIFLRKKCTYKEVADEILKNQVLDNEKNIRRRVYDAINVLTATGVFEKKGKIVQVSDGKKFEGKSVKKKKETLKKLSKRFENLNGIICRNKDKPNLRQAIQLPFFLIVTKKNVR